LSLLLTRCSHHSSASRVRTVKRSCCDEGMSPLATSASPEPEPPFRPREKILEKQRYFQSVHKPTYLEGRYDVITSVAIPLALAVSSMYLVGRGIYNMSHGIGKE
ncbi:unnamed protein product, partial [Urochloa humidicola]